MNRIQLRIASQSENVQCTHTIDWKEYAASLNQLLTEADDRQLEQLNLSCYNMTSVRSENFNGISVQLRTIARFLRLHHYPHSVTILCDNIDTVNLYQQVYRFYLADSKDRSLTVQE